MALDIVPKFHELMWPAIVALREIGGSANIEELEEKVAELLNLSEAQLAVPHGESGKSEFGYRLAWARTYLKFADLTENSGRGIWLLTSKGRSIDAEETKKILKQVRSQRAPSSRKNPENEPAEVTGEISWKDALLDHLKSLKPDAFERLSQLLLRESGFSKVAITGRSGDGGIDGSGVLRINLVSFQIAFQCKRWKDAVSSPTVRDFRGAMIGRADKGLIITTGRFTADAQREAIRDGAPTIDLVDGDALCDLLKNLKLGVSIKLVEEIKIDRAFLDAI